MCRPSILPASKSSDSSLGSNGPTPQMPVSNDVYLGEDADDYHPGTLLLTGPNMGGKSTLLRATCLAVILAQLGCYVPCEICVLSLVDIILTRLGATDRIMTGKSKLTKLYVEPRRLTSGHPCSALLLEALNGASNT